MTQYALFKDNKQISKPFQTIKEVWAIAIKEELVLVLLDRIILVHHEIRGVK